MAGWRKSTPGVTAVINGVTAHPLLPVIAAQSFSKGDLTVVSRRSMGCRKFSAAGASANTLLDTERPVEHADRTYLATRRCGATLYGGRELTTERLARAVGAMLIEAINGGRPDVMKTWMTYGYPRTPAMPKVLRHRTVYGTKTTYAPEERSALGCGFGPTEAARKAEQKSGPWNKKAADG